MTGTTSPGLSSVVGLVLLTGWLMVIGRCGVTALDNGLALTPPLGFNTWNNFRCDMNETLIRAIADAMVSSGLSKAGYVYVNIDDCWAENQRDANNNLVANRTQWPSGIPALSAYVHSKGLRFGMYSDAGSKMCLVDAPGSLGHEEQDATLFAKWEVDYLNNAAGLPFIPRYTAMRDALVKTARPILYSMCAALFDLYQPMWSRVIGNSWRTTTDIGRSWGSILFNLDGNNQWWQWAGRGGWNDPDMLRVGQGFLSDDEETKRTVEILTNTEVIALDQDPLGRQGRCVVNDTALSVQVWAVALENGDVAAVLFNRDDRNNRTVTAHWVDLGITPAAAVMQLRDLWLHQDLGLFNTSYTVTLLPHASVTVRLHGTDPLNRRTGLLSLAHLTWPPVAAT